MPLVPVNGVRLLVEESGAGEPLVLVHGSWDDRTVWAGVEGELARDLRVVSYDRRGHSDSGDGAGPGSRRDDEEDLAALIEALAIAPAHVAANSFGASVALGMAARHGDLVRSLCAHEPPLVSLAPGDPGVARFLADIDEVLPMIDRGEAEAAAREFVERVIAPGVWEHVSRQERTMMAANAGTFAGEVRDPDWPVIELAPLAAPRFPVVLTRGDASLPMFGAIMARLSEAMPRAEVRTIPGAGHVPHATHPSEWAAAVRAATGAAVSRS